MIPVPLVKGIDVEIVPSQHDEACESRVRGRLDNKTRANGTSGFELLPTALYFHSRLLSLSILRTARKEPTSNVVVDLLVVAAQVRNMGSRVNGRMRFIVVSTISGPLKPALLKPCSRNSSSQYGLPQPENIQCSHCSKSPVAPICLLLLNKRHEIKLGIELVGLRSGIRQETLLIQSLSDLIMGQHIDSFSEKKRVILRLELS